MKTRLPLAALLLASAAALPGCGLAPSGRISQPLSAELVVPSGGAFEIRNLAGSIHVVQGDGEAVVVRATIHATSPELASRIRLEESPGDEGARVLTVKYPLDEHRNYMYPRGSDVDSEWLKLLGAGNNMGSTYDGERVKVSTSSGLLLYADLEIALPRHDVRGTISNLVGDVTAEDLRGDLSLETTSGAVKIDGARGAISAQASFGDVSASRVEGSFTGKTTNGSIGLDDFRGDAIDCTSMLGDIEAERLEADKVTASSRSGTIRISGKAARIVKAQTARGDISTKADLVEEFDVGTASGRIQLFAPGRHLNLVDAGTAVGDVELAMGEESGFDLRMNVPEERVEMRYDGVEKVEEEGRLVGYRRGDGRTKIKVDIRHGRLLVHPEAGASPKTDS